MKFSIGIMNKKSEVLIFDNTKPEDMALIGAALIFKAARKIAQEKNITYEKSIKTITDAIIETNKPVS